MRTSTDRIDQLALVWLVVPRKESRVSGFYPQLKDVAPGKDEKKRLAEESIARLRERGMIEPGKLLRLTEAGRREALGILGVPRLTERIDLKWAKKALLLRGLGTEPTLPGVQSAGRADVLAARILARHHNLDRSIEAAASHPVGAKTVASKVVAALARRALGMEEKSALKFDEVFSAVFLRPNGSAVSLKLAACSLGDFASVVREAARSAATGRWHGAVFISHVWNTLRARGDVGISFKEFQRRLVEAHQRDLLELSRADLVEAMPAADVSASETVHSGARFHFVRLEQLAS